MKKTKYLRRQHWFIKGRSYSLTDLVVWFLSLWFSYTWWKKNASYIINANWPVELKFILFSKMPIVEMQICRYYHGSRKFGNSAFINCRKLTSLRKWKVRKKALIKMTVEIYVNKPQKTAETQIWLKTTKIDIPISSILTETGYGHLKSLIETWMYLLMVLHTKKMFAAWLQNGLCRSKMFQKAKWQCLTCFRSRMGHVSSSHERSWRKLEVLSAGARRWRRRRESVVVVAGLKVFVRVRKDPGARSGPQDRRGNQVGAESERGFLRAWNNKDKLDMLNLQYNVLTC
jgi:hypothetical protein